MWNNVSTWLTSRRDTESRGGAKAIVLHLIGGIRLHQQGKDGAEWGGGRRKIKRLIIKGMKRQTALMWGCVCVLHQTLRECILCAQGG